MAKKIILKTQKKALSVTTYINAMVDERQKKEAKKLLQLFKKATGLTAKMWGASIIGFGEYTYYRANGDEGSFLATGFSMRKTGPTIYIMPGYQDYMSILPKLGKYKLGKSCLYLKSLDDIDTGVLEKLIQKGLKDLKKSHKTNY